MPLLLIGSVGYANALNAGTVVTVTVQARPARSPVIVTLRQVRPL